MTTIRLEFSKSSVDLSLIDNLASATLVSMLKHLQHIPVPQYLFDNPYNFTPSNVSAELVKYGKLFGIDIDVNRLTDQVYLNELHSHYENGYNGNPDWLHYHEATHVAEIINESTPPYNWMYHIGYRELAGPLEKKFTRDHCNLFVTEVEQGDCFVEFSELGKTPYDYWEDGEADSLDRFCQLAKPCIKFRPKFSIAIQDQQLLPDTEQLDRFTQWYIQYKSDWCRHWQISDWSIQDIFGVIKIGTVTDFNQLDQLLKDHDSVTKLTLI
jgi:hypothetical protein